VTFEAVEGDGRVERVRLADGSIIPCDVLLVAVGVAPETRWLETCGLVLDDGVVCDETLHAAPGVVAAGDLCRWPNAMFDGEVMRLEHWTNAAEQGVFAAQSLLRRAAGETIEGFAPVPFVWSDQYGVKIQCVGRFGPSDDLQVAHGDLSDRQFVALFGRHDRLVGALAFSRPRQLMQYRRMIAERASFRDALAHARGAD
jgi:NADPH-dependent 2,4-dienoyl-CoA reductase/sulfur reductase-like enzyme